MLTVLSFGTLISTAGQHLAIHCCLLPPVMSNVNTERSIGGPRMYASSFRMLLIISGNTDNFPAKQSKRSVEPSDNLPV